MRFAVIGAGAIGGFLGARLALSGQDVTFIARGATLAALRRSGFRLIDKDGREHTVRPAALPIEGAGPYDAILLAVKAHQVAGVAEGVRRMTGPDTVVLTLQNGVPWWYFQGLSGPHAGRSLKSVDPDGRISAAIDPKTVIGSVIYPATEVIAPAQVRVIEEGRFTLGEPDGSRSERVTQLSNCFQAAGLKAPVSADIRSEIWLKILGNAVFNPISALTHATLQEICDNELSVALARAAMGEIVATAESVGARVRTSIDKRIAGARAVGHHRTSMLQDVEHGRAIEHEALIGAVIELARLGGVETPRLDTLYALAALLSASLTTHDARLALDTSPPSGQAQ